MLLSTEEQLDRFNTTSKNENVLASEMQEDVELKSETMFGDFMITSEAGSVETIPIYDTSCSGSGKGDELAGTEVEVNGKETSLGEAEEQTKLNFNLEGRRDIFHETVDMEEKHGFTNQIKSAPEPSDRPDILAEHNLWDEKHNQSDQENRFGCPDNRPVEHHNQLSDEDSQLIDRDTELCGGGKRLDYVDNQTPNNNQSDSEDNQTSDKDNQSGEKDSQSSDQGNQSGQEDNGVCKEVCRPDDKEFGQTDVAEEKAETETMDDSNVESVAKEELNIETLATCKEEAIGDSQSSAEMKQSLFGDIDSGQNVIHVKTEKTVDDTERVSNEETQPFYDVEIGVAAECSAKKSSLVRCSENVVPDGLANGGVLREEDLFGNDEDLDID